MTNPKCGTKGRGGTRQSLLGRCTNCLPICVRRRDERIQLEQDLPARSIRAQRSHSEFTLTRPVDATPVSSGAQWLPPRPLPPHTCVPMPSLCLPCRPRTEQGRAELKTHSEAQAGRTPTGPGASAGLQENAGGGAGTQQLPPSQLLLGIRPTQLPGLEWI